MNASLIGSNPPATAEIEVLDNLVKHTRKLALTDDPQKRIEASKWQIFFQDRLHEARLQQQPELFDTTGEELQQVAED